MSQWHPPSGSQRPRPGWEWGTAAQPAAGADDSGYPGDGWNPGQEPTAGYGTQTRQREHAAAPAFSQEFCEVDRVSAGGNLQPGLPGTSFIVQIADGWLTVTEAPVIPVFSVPADEVQITTPRWQREIGTSSILRVAGQLWSVQFSRVHQAEAAHAGRGGAVRMMLTAGAPRKSISRAREINARFTAALLAAGAADTPAEQVSGRAGRR
jgi:hypothetical protein